MSGSKPVPAALLRAVLEANRLSGSPQLSAGCRDEAIAWLTRVLTRYDDFEAHLMALRQIMDLPPTPRLLTHDTPTGVSQRMVDGLYLQFPRRSPLSEETAFPILEQGLEAAADDTLAELLINPMALDLLRTLVEDEPSEPWTRARLQAGRELLDQKPE